MKKKNFSKWKLQCSNSLDIKIERNQISGEEKTWNFWKCELKENNLVNFIGGEREREMPVVWNAYLRTELLKTIKNVISK